MPKQSWAHYFPIFSSFSLGRREEIVESGNTGINEKFGKVKDAGKLSNAESGPRKKLYKITLFYFKVEYL